MNESFEQETYFTDQYTTTNQEDILKIFKEIEIQINQHQFLIKFMETEDIEKCLKLICATKTNNEQLNQRKIKLRHALLKIYQEIIEFEKTTLRNENLNPNLTQNCKFLKKLFSLDPLTQTISQSYSKDIPDNLSFELTNNNFCLSVPNHSSSCENFQFLQPQSVPKKIKKTQIKIHHDFTLKKELGAENFERRVSNNYIDNSILLKDILNQENVELKNKTIEKLDFTLLKSQEFLNSRENMEVISQNDTINQYTISDVNTVYINGKPVSQNLLSNVELMPQEITENSYLNQENKVLCNISHEQRKDKNISNQINKISENKNLEKINSNISLNTTQIIKDPTKFALYEKFYAKSSSSKLNLSFDVNKEDITDLLSNVGTFKEELESLINQELNNNDFSNVEDMEIEQNITSNSMWNFDEKYKNNHFELEAICKEYENTFGSKKKPKNLTNENTINMDNFKWKKMSQIIKMFANNEN